VTGASTSDIVVVIAAHNAAKTIERAVRSAVGQPHVAEVLVIDDGSSDTTAELAQAAGAQVVTQANAGPASARNRGIDLAASRSPTPSALFLDADDELLPHATRSLHAVASALGPDISGIVSGHAQVAGGTFVEASKERRVPTEWMVSSSRDPSMHLLRDTSVILGPAHVFCTTGFLLGARSIAAGIRFNPRLHFAEDRDLIYRAAAIGPLGACDDVLVRKHDADDRMTANPARAARWLADQIALTREHMRTASPAVRTALADSLTWVLKHALRTAQRGSLSRSVVRDALSLLRDAQRPIPFSVRRLLLISRLRGTLSDR
jgi:glycosyltransferase involved in cell wall biosynthesis